MLEYLESIVTLWQTQDRKKLALSVTVQLHLKTLCCGVGFQKKTVIVFLE